MALVITRRPSIILANDELRGVLNSGHRAGGNVVRTVGEDFEPHTFATFAPAAIALIGKLPGTLADRSVSLELRRRRADEPAQPYRHDRTAHLDELARKLARWAADHADDIRGADPDMPDGVYNRVADNWRPLLAIADAAGGEWPERARRALQCAVAGVGEDDSARIMLLADIRDIFREREAERLASAELCASLIAIEGRPWAEWRGGKPLSANGLARLLVPFKVIPGTIRIGEATAKGYQLAHFADAFARYLPCEP